MKGCNIIVESLKKEGVDTIFGYPGGAIMAIDDALMDEKEIHYILARHVQGATHEADGYARATGKVGVVLATSRSEERRGGKECRSRWSPYH